MALGFASAAGAGAMEVARGVVVIGYNDSAVTAGIARTEAMTRKGGGAISKLTLGIATGFAVAAGAGAKMGMTFQANMTLIQTSAGATAAEVRQLTGEVLKLARVSPFGPNELAKALYHLKSLGYDNVKAMAALRAGIRGAIAGQSDLESTVNALGAAYQTGIEGMGSFEMGMRRIDAIAGAGNMRLQDLIGALSTGILPAAKTAGLSLTDVGAALAVMVDQGQNANMAATRLRMSFSLLGAPSKKAEDQLNLIGLSGNQLAQAMNHRPNGLLYTLELLKQHLDRLPNKTERFQLLSRAFGGGRSAGAIMLLINSLDLMGKKYVQMGHIVTRFDKNVKDGSQTSAMKVRTAWAKVQVFLIGLGNAVLPVIVKLAQVLGAIGGVLTDHMGAIQKLVKVLLIAAGLWLTYRTNLLLVVTAIKLYEAWVLRAEIATGVLNGTLIASGASGAAAGASMAGGMRTAASSAMIANARVAALRANLIALAGMVVVVSIYEIVKAFRGPGQPTVNKGAPGRDKYNYPGRDSSGKILPGYREDHGKVIRTHPARDYRYPGGPLKPPQTYIIAEIGTNPDGLLPSGFHGKQTPGRYNVYDRHGKLIAANVTKAQAERLQNMSGTKAGRGKAKAAVLGPPNFGKPMPLPYEIQIEEAKASGTRSEKDDLAAYKHERAWLQRQMRRANLSKAQRLDFAQRIGQVNQQIYSIEDQAANKGKAARDKRRREAEKRARERDKLNLPQTLLLGIARAKAKTPNDKSDDILAFEAEEKWLQAQIKHGHNSKKRLTALYSELAKVRNDIKKLREEDKKKKDAVRREAMAFLTELHNTFYGQFAPDIFTKDVSGKLHMGSSGTVVHDNTKNITVNQTFPHSGPVPHLHAYRSAKFAAETQG